MRHARSPSGATKPRPNTVRLWPGSPKANRSRLPPAQVHASAGACHAPCVSSFKLYSNSVISTLVNTIVRPTPCCWDSPPHDCICRAGCVALYSVDGPGASTRTLRLLPYEPRSIPDRSLRRRSDLRCEVTRRRTQQPASTWPSDLPSTAGILPHYAPEAQRVSAQHRE